MRWLQIQASTAAWKLTRSLKSLAAYRSHWTTNIHYNGRAGRRQRVGIRNVPPGL